MWNTDQDAQAEGSLSQSCLCGPGATTSQVHDHVCRFGVRVDAEPRQSCEVCSPHLFPAMVRALSRTEFCMMMAWICTMRRVRKPDSPHLMPPDGLRHKVSVPLVAEGAVKVGFPTSPASGKCAACPDPTVSPPRSSPGSLGGSLSLSLSSSVSIKLAELSYPPPRVEVLSCLRLQRQSLVLGAKTRKCLCQTRKHHHSLSPKWLLWFHGGCCVLSSPAHHLAAPARELRSVDHVGLTMWSHVAMARDHPRPRMAGCGAAGRACPPGHRHLHAVVFGRAVPSA